MSDADWIIGQRKIGPFFLDCHGVRGRWRSHVWFNDGATLHRIGGFLDADTPAAAKRAAEDALRTLCRDTLAALGDAPPPT